MTSPVAMPTRTRSDDAGRRLEIAHRRHELEPSPNRPLGIVLLSPWVAEVGQDPIAHVLGDEATEAFDARGDEPVVGADKLTQVLRIEVGSECGRAHQVDEHHRELPALGL